MSRLRAAVSHDCFREVLRKNPLDDLQLEFQANDFDIHKFGINFVLMMLLLWQLQQRTSTKLTNHKECVCARVRMNILDY